ncbi:MAG: hypothetical protein M1814_006852 [Vezdaea aestivalis]|nr:MAG: hypothetical protein M1814_006852 [Vezdaea aestivalis]
MRTAAFLSVAATAFAALTSAYTQPVGDSPSGNPITKPGLNEIVPVGTPYTITWTATTPGTVTLLLLRGPSTNVVPIGPPIVEAIANTGTYQWTPPATLEPDTTRYGIQLIVDSNGAYQYTSQFGISNPNYTGGNATTTTTGAANGTATTYVVPTTAVNTTCIYCLGNVTASAQTVPSSIVLPTGTLTVPSTLVPVVPTAATSAPAASSASAAATATGAAARKELGALVGLVGVAALLI